MTRDELLTAALEARKHAYAPYSGFTVGAALEAADGTVYTGCNVENASYGLTCCAERTALYHAVSCGARDFTAVAVVGGRQNEETPTDDCTPCGICRQALSEFCADDLTIHLQTHCTTLGALLPNAFRLE